MKKLFVLVFLLFILSLILPGNIFASSLSGSSASLSPEIKAKNTDVRVLALKKVFLKYNSILEPYSETYIKSADKYGVDWRLLPSIAGLESTFGRAYIQGTYNVYGWGSGLIYFDSWEHGINEINSKLKENYMDKWGAKDVWEIGPIYAESPTWAVRVNSFMSEMNREYLTLSSKESLKLNL